MEATDKIDWRALHKRVVIGETPKPVNVEAQPVCRHLSCPKWCRRHSPFVFRRANLVRVP